MLWFIIALSVLVLIGWVYLALFHGSFWQPLLIDDDVPSPTLWPSVDIIVPARNEAEALPKSLPSLMDQDYPGPWRIILIDDHSTDNTASVAYRIADKSQNAHRLMVLNAAKLPEGWSGKVAALQNGVDKSIGEYLLFTDADIAHPKNSLRRLVARSMADDLDLNSLMVKLNCSSFAEKLLIPAFVFFFSMLYPFRKANDPSSKIAAAAGGVMLVKQKALANIGGMARIKSALIDDCSLAAAIKLDGGPKGSMGNISLSLAKDVLSVREYPQIADIWKMIARTAFTQLNYSALLLLGTVLGLALLFMFPILALLTGCPVLAETGFASYMIMTCIYAAIVRFYGLSFLWALALPLSAIFYIGATIDSAIQYWQGKGGMWKDRTQAVQL
ncbi:MAG: glycosyltransferase [Alphaproteobacteria bacterium]|nr:glycosyltransferase [Alphaproteobacteria bacterium]